MKKRKHILGLLVIVLFVFSSCQHTNLPSSSATFSRSFVKNFFTDYQLVDLQLAYRTASPCEVEILNVPTPGSRFDSALLSQITNVGSLDFVAVTELRSYYLMGGAPHNSTWVYKKTDAPNPMADWTISRVDVLEFSDREYEERFVRRSGKSWNVEDLGQTHISSATVLFSFTSSDIGFFETVKESYDGAKMDTEWVEHSYQFNELVKHTATYSPNKSEIGDRLYYSVLVCFEESEELVWESQLYICDEVLYFACFSYDGQNSQNITKRFARLDDELSQIILDCLKLETDDSGGSSQPVESEPSVSQ